MRHTELISSNLISCGYEKAGDTGTLEIRFRSGSLYRYDLVPESVYQGLQAADSPGKYFASEIRHRYPGTRLEG